MSLIGESKERILFYIAEHGEGYGYAISKELDIQLPAVYEHLRDLEEADVLKSEMEGRRRTYELTEDGTKLVDVLQ